MSEFPSRISAKFFLASEEGVDAAALIPVLHGWIRCGGVVDGLLIDVADYHHVPDGPGVLLIGHEWDRSIDYADGRPGVLSVAKRDLQGDLQARIAAVAADALYVAAAFAAEPTLAGTGVLIDTVEIRVLDRLYAPNTPEAFEAIGPGIAAALAPLNGGTPPDLVQVGDTRRPFRVLAGLAGGLTDPADARDALRGAVVA